MTGTDLINVIVLVCLVFSFCDINAIMHGSTISHDGISIIFELYADFS